MKGEKKELETGLEGVLGGFCNSDRADVETAVES